LLVACVPDPVSEQEKSVNARFSADASGEAIYQSQCSTCHTNPVSKAPLLQAMQTKNLSSISFELFLGKMRSQAASLSYEQKIKVAEYIAGGKQPYQPEAWHYCENKNVQTSQVFSGGRGFDERHTAAVGKAVANIDSSNVATLTLQWVFALPNTSDTRSQPVIANDTLFVAAQGGDVFALDRHTGCIQWHLHTGVPVRTSLTLVELPEGKRTLLLYGDSESYVNAVDAKTGERVWRTDAAISDYSILTGAITASVDTESGESFLIVPVSTYEVIVATDPTHECCQSHGAVHRLATASGQIIWTKHLAEAAAPRGVSKAGVRQWGPSGVPVWSTPTIDSARGVVYVGTGENASAPATALSDAVVALDLANGDKIWHFQGMAGDTWNGACGLFPVGSNCPARQGPDYDFGASVIVATNTAGKALLLAGQKSGDIYALDPDNKGELLWQTRIGTGSAVGGVHWGMAIADGKVFAAANDPPFPGKIRQPGLYALAIDSGEQLWNYPLKRRCETDREAYFQRRELYPECSYFFSFSAALTIANDVVFAPALDGTIRAFNSANGELLWQFMTANEFETVAGTKARGGSMDNVGVIFAGNYVYMQSGYSLFGALPGNILLAFSIDE